MKNFKKVICIAICSIMVLGVSLSVFADETQNTDTGENAISTTETNTSNQETSESTTDEDKTDSAEASPAPKPTQEPTPEPTQEPTPEPTQEPTPEPTQEPTPTTAPVVNNGEITVRVNGADVVFDDVKPQIIDGRTLVPIRKVGEALNASVAWRFIDSTVHIFRNGTTIMLTMGKSEMSVREYEYVDKLIYTTEPKADMYIDPDNKDVVARMIDDRTMIPFRAVCEALGGQVDWDGNQNLITVNIPQYTLTLADKDAANLIENWNYQPTTQLKNVPVETPVVNEGNTDTTPVGNPVVNEDNTDTTPVENPVVNEGDANTTSTTESSNEATSTTETTQN